MSDDGTRIPDVGVSLSTRLHEVRDAIVFTRADRDARWRAVLYDHRWEHWQDHRDCQCGWSAAAAETDIEGAYVAHVAAVVAGEVPTP